ncbi:MAG: apolipoprotein N-acyltransferase [bacterium]
MTVETTMRDQKLFTDLTREQLVVAGILPAPVDAVTELARPHPTTPPQPGMIVWPENAVQYSYLHSAELQQLVDESQQVLIYGSLTSIPIEDPQPGAAGVPPPISAERELYEHDGEMGRQLADYNSVEVRIPGSPEPVAVESKYHLVPFGESVPMRRYLSIMTNPFPHGSLTAASEVRPIDTPAGRVGIVVCYESALAPLVRKLVWEGANVLVLSSNTSWFDQYIDATWQHAYYDRMRAVENRIPFVRSSTTGVSSIIDAWGHEVAITEPSEGAGIEGEPLPRPAGAARTATIYPRTGWTLYTLLGDWVVYGAAFGLLAVLVHCWLPDWKLLWRTRLGPMRQGTRHRRPLTLTPAAEAGTIALDD